MWWSIRITHEWRDRWKIYVFTDYYDVTLYTRFWDQLNGQRILYRIDQAELAFTAEWIKMIRCQIGFIRWHESGQISRKCAKNLTFGNKKSFFMESQVTYRLHLERRTWRCQNLWDLFKRNYVTCIKKHTRRQVWLPRPCGWKRGKTKQRI
jgi:hypothetical protein